VLRTEITFLPPAEMVDPDLLAGFDGAVVGAVLHALDEADRRREPEAGRFLHAARRTGYGTELRSRFWLAVPQGTDLTLVTAGRLRHVHEEFAYLTGFLPALYAREAR
jgi:hypothetical protein